MEVRFDQPIFSRGELDPTMQKRTDYEGYYKGLKFARNVLLIPQGGAQSRWGTSYVDTLSIVDPTQPQYCQISNYILDDTTVYVFVWEALSLRIYLENILVATVVTPFTQEDIPNIREFQVLEKLIIAWGRAAPYQLTVGPLPADVITGISGNTLTVTTALTIGRIWPVQFTTNATLPVTNPQIYINVTYYAKAITTNSVAIYSTSEDAAAGINQYTVITAGTGTNNLLIINDWTLGIITFDNIPAFDFLHNYDAHTFTPGATSGAVTITVSAALATLDARYIGGVFAGNGGTMRITAVGSTTSFSGTTLEDFNNTNAIQGNLALLAQPAWSDTLGWPALVTAYQNRLVFGRTRSLPNGRWLSVTNSYYNFNDADTLDDDAISWYPQGAGIGYIQALTSCRTLVVHTNTNTQSTPVLNEVPLTPTNANFPEQSKFGALPIQPIYLDNQIIFVDKGNNVINMIWEITQSAFVTKNISIPSSGLIRLPVDMAAFAQPVSTDGFYAMFVNADGTLANFQSLLEEDVRAWSLMDTFGSLPIDQQGNSRQVADSFVHVTTALDRCWFLIQRQTPVGQTPVPITSFNGSNSTLFAAFHGLPVNEISQISFTSTGMLPATTPMLNPTTYYFAVAVDINNFLTFSTYAEAQYQIDYLGVGPLPTPIAIMNAGTNSNVVYWQLTKQIFLEELDFDVYTDCTFNYSFSTPSTFVSGLQPLNGQVVQVKADGYVLSDQLVVNGQIPLQPAFGPPQLPNTGYKKVQVGLQFIPKVTPLPISVPGMMGTIYNPQHVRSLYIAYTNSIGMQIQGSDIPVITMQQFVVGKPITPQTGVWLYTPMEGWDSQSFEFDVTQPYPLPMTITGFSYKLEVV